MAVLLNSNWCLNSWHYLRQKNTTSFLSLQQKKSLEEIRSDTNCKLGGDSDPILSTYIPRHLLSAHCLQHKICIVGILIKNRKEYQIENWRVVKLKEIHNVIWWIPSRFVKFNCLHVQMRQQFLMPKILTRSSQPTLFGCSFTLASPRKQNTLFHSLKVEIRGFCPRKQLGVIPTVNSKSLTIWCGLWKFALKALEESTPLQDVLLQMHKNHHQLWCLKECSNQQKFTIPSPKYVLHYPFWEILKQRRASILPVQTQLIATDTPTNISMWLQTKLHDDTLKINHNVSSSKIKSNTTRMRQVSLTHRHKVSDHHHPHE